jgi:hypothetical protein
VALAWARQEVERYNPNAGRWRRAMNPWRTVKAWTRQRVFEHRRWSKRQARYLDEEGKKRDSRPKRLWWPRKPQARSWARETPSEKKASSLITAEAFNCQESRGAAVSDPAPPGFALVRIRRCSLDANVARVQRWRRRRKRQKFPASVRPCVERGASDKAPT